ncbi:flagellar biosynthetic protein FliR [Fusibacter sp. JL216-2]|uniref:flagellar biosynthetic protein FliR n=1 Tax=Fusibacter sp. JL216-2 TaxID=3071453 RepID=UPI003D349F66
MILTSLLVGLILMISRMSGMFSIIPVFSSRNIPAQAKIGLIFFTSYVMLPIVDLSYVEGITTLLEMAYLIIIEFIIGLMLGAVMQIALSCIYLAGTFIDRNTGFAMVSVVNPIGTEQLAVSANLLYVLAMILFFVIDGHHQLIRVIARSYEVAPVGSGFINLFVSLQLTDLMQEAFILGFKLAAPFIITVFIGNMLLGLLAKAMPGMNVFLLGLPFKVSIGFFLFVVLLSSYVDALTEVYGWIWEMLAKIMFFIKI